MIEGSQAIIQKFIYIFGNFVCLMLAMYKCQTMGLLPTHASDWLAFMDPQKVCWSHDKLTLNIFYISFMLCHVYYGLVM